jgi:hypothetical protein
MACTWLIGVVFAALCGGLSCSPADFDDAYAKWGTGDMVISYMKDHDDHWPKSWDDLAPYFAQNNVRVGGWSYEKLQSRIVIDFKADPKKLKESATRGGRPTFNVIRARSGTLAWEGREPNQMIYNYLHGRAPYAGPVDAKE